MGATEYTLSVQAIISILALLLDLCEIHLSVRKLLLRFSPKQHGAATQRFQNLTDLDVTQFRPQPYQCAFFVSVYLDTHLPSTEIDVCLQMAVPALKSILRLDAASDQTLTNTAQCSGSVKRTWLIPLNVSLIMSRFFQVTFHRWEHFCDDTPINKASWTPTSTSD